MAARISRRKRPNVNLSYTFLESIPRTTGRALSLLGKPFYLLLTWGIISTLFLFYIIGHSTRHTVATLLKSLVSVAQGGFAKVEHLRKRSIVVYSKKKSRIPTLKRVNLSFLLPKIKPPSFSKIKIVTVILLSTLSLIGTFWFVILKDLPSPKELTTRKQKLSTKIYDRNGVLLYKIYKKENRTLAPLTDIPPYVKYAVIAIEDNEFYLHPGFSAKGIIRSIVKNIRKGQLSGGSTITQQLVKNALLNPEKTFTRKIKELILAVEVELSYSKDQILEMYLNEVSFGGTAYGIEEAAQTYFGKDVKNLTVGEGALLAGLPKSPTRYSPFGVNPDLAITRQHEVINAMQVNRYISPEDALNAKNEVLSFAQQKTDIKAPHFVMYVRDQLVNKFGEEVVNEGGLEVTTSLDLGIQEMAEEVVKKNIDKLTNLRVGNGAALVTNPSTGEILAMVGSKDYFDLKNDGNVNVTTSLRQPGSSIKLINYSYALSNGYTPATTIDDSPITFDIRGSKPYSPKNYDGTYRGRITLRSALAESRNIPAVKVLASYGVTKMIEQGRKMGITTWNDPSRFGLSLTLGGGEVKLTDLVTAYGVVANYGKRVDLNSILEVKNTKASIYRPTCKVDREIPGIPISQAAEASETGGCYEQVLDPRVAFLLIDILRDNNARAPAFGLQSQLVIPKHAEVAVKTGTSNDLKDNYTIGFNQKYLVGVWVGNNDSSPMGRLASGITGAAPIWNEITRRLLASESNHPWLVPANLVQTNICSLTGTLPCDGCPSIRSEWFLAENAPKEYCNLKPVVDEINQEGVKDENDRIEKIKEKIRKRIFGEQPLPTP